MNQTYPVPLWLRWWAWVTVLTTLLLVVLGAEVTTKKVGMADPVGLRNPLYLFESEHGSIRALYLWQTNNLGLLIEHAHRLFGWIVGLQCLIFAVGMAVSARGGFRLLGLLAGVGVGLQGLLGIARVAFNLEAGPGLSTVHGCSAQLVFASLVAVAVMTTPAWSTAGNSIPASLLWAAWLVVGLIYVQMVFGAILRHMLNPVAQRLHVLLAFAVVVGIITVTVRAKRTDPTTGVLGIALHVLVLFQPILGVEAWIRRFGSLTVPDAVPSTLAGDLVRSGHHVLGTLIFASMVALATLLARPRMEVSSPSTLHVRALEAAV